MSLPCMGWSFFKPLVLTGGCAAHFEKPLVNVMVGNGNVNSGFKLQFKEFISFVKNLQAP